MEICWIISVICRTDSETVRIRCKDRPTSFLWLRRKGNFLCLVAIEKEAVSVKRLLLWLGTRWLCWVLADNEIETEEAGFVYKDVLWIVGECDDNATHEWASSKFEPVGWKEGWREYAFLRSHWRYGVQNAWDLFGYLTRELPSIGKTYFWFNLFVNRWGFCLFTRLTSLLCACIVLYTLCSVLETNKKRNL